MKIVIFGLGSIGERHARILEANFKCQVYAFRSGHSTKGNPAGLPVITTWKEVDHIKPDAAFITNPTSEHVATALKCASRGIKLFIEKPVSDSLKGVDQLIRLGQKHKLPVYIAYCLRFHPVIEKIKELLKGQKAVHARVVCSSMLHQWRPGDGRKKNYSSRKAMGGGVILDLSHEFDYIQYLLGDIDKISGVKGRMGNVTIDAEDFCDTIVTLENGTVVNCHLNFSSCDTRRTIQIDLKDGVIEGDLIKGTVISQKKGKLKQFILSTDRDAYLKKQAEYFIKNLNNPRLMNNLQEAKPLLKKILEFRNAR